jgi:hypothetical protein
VLRPILFPVQGPALSGTGLGTPGLLFGRLPLGSGLIPARAIDYRARPWIRTIGYVPTGSPGLPAILRNPQTTVGAYDQDKIGPSPFLKLGPADYLMYHEGFTDDQQLPDTNFVMWSDSADGINWNHHATPTIFPTLAWHNGEVCPTEFLYNPDTNEFFLYYHGGNNSGPRQIGLATSPTGRPGTWTLYGTTPIFSNSSTGGAFDEAAVADVRVMRVSATEWHMIYEGFRVSDNKVQIGHAISPDGKVWTRAQTTPILPLGSGNDSDRVIGTDFDIDENGRIHIWYVGSDSGGTQRVLYAFSDDWKTWSRNQADVISSKSATSTEPDFTAIGDTLRHIRDDGILLFTQRAQNISTYVADAFGRIETRGLHWMPDQAVLQPTRPGRAFMNYLGATREYSQVPPAAKLMNSSVFTLWVDFRCPPGNTTREMYRETAAFNQLCYLRLTTAGKVDAWFRTPTNNAPITSTARYDDNQWHRAMFVRRSNADFELYVDGVSVGTSTVACGTDATATFCAWGNQHPSSGGSSEPLMGVMRQGVIIQGRALTPTEELDLWNGGADGGVLPAGVTATVWTKHGSGGKTGLDLAYSDATFGVTAVSGTTLVETAPRAVPPAPSGTNVAANVAALTLTGFAPTVTVSDNQNALAGIAALSLTGFAPTVFASDNKAALAGVGALSLAGFAPTVAISNNQSVAAGLGALSFTGFAPTVVIGVRALAGVGALTLSGFAPTVAVSNNQTVAAGLGALSLAGFAPTVAVSDNKTVAAGVAALSLTGFAPSVVIGFRSLAGVAALSLTGFAPTIAVSDNKSAAAGAGALSLTGFAPSVVIGVRALAGVGALALTGFAPSVAVSNHKVVLPGVGALSLAGFAPTVVATANQTVLAGQGALALTGFAPTVSSSNQTTAAPGTGALALAGFAPTVVATNHQIAAPGAGALALAGFAPALAISDHRIALPGAGLLALVGFAPTVVATANQIVAALTAALIFTGFAPTVLVQSPSQDLLLSEVALLVNDGRTALVSDRGAVALLADAGRTAMTCDRGATMLIPD